MDHIEEEVALEEEEVVDSKITILNRKMKRLLDNFQPKIGFKTRYGIQANPFAENSGSSAAVINGAGNINSNRYYRRVQVTNIM